MLQLTVYNRSGEQVDTIEIDEQALGGFVKKRLLREAVAMYEANRRVGSAFTKTRAEINLTGAKMYRQKGTGRARHGAAKVNLMRGGGPAFGPRPRNYHYRMSRKALRSAFRSALLGKMLDDEVVVVDELTFTEPKTRLLAETMSNLNIDGSCVVAIEKHSEPAYKSARNIQKVALKTISDVNAYDLLRHKQLLISRAALDAALQRGAAAPENGPGDETE